MALIALIALIALMALIALIALIVRYRLVKLRANGPYKEGGRTQHRLTRKFRVIPYGSAIAI